MRAVHIPDELYEVLKSIGLEMKNQDNRGTADPFFYQILEQKQYPTSEDYCDGREWYSEDADSSIADDKQSKIEALLDYEEMEETNLKEKSEEALDELLEEKGWRLYYYKNIEKLTNCFFTEKGIKEHITRNRHHYEAEVQNYVEHAWRNPEMEAVVKLLRMIAEQ